MKKFGQLFKTNLLLVFSSTETQKLENNRGLLSKRKVPVVNNFPCPFMYLKNL